MPSGGAPPKFGKDVLKCAEQIDGLHFTDAEEELAAGGASRTLDSYEELRQLNVPLDTHRDHVVALSARRRTCQFIVFPLIEAGRSAEGNRRAEFERSEPVRRNGVRAAGLVERVQRLVDALGRELKGAEVHGDAVG